MSIRRGEVYIAALDPVIGKEISKTRPVVVVSNDLSNQFAATVTVLPITSMNVDKIYPFEVFVPKGSGGLPKDSKVKADQVRTLDKARLAKRLGKVDQKQITEIDKAMKIHLGMEE
jgi:mRNA interferase MazF